MIKNKKKVFVVLGFILIGTIIYANSFKNPFIWDQEVAIVGNPLVQSWENWPQIFAKNVEGRPLTSAGFYRPIETLSYLIDHSFWGFNPFGFHLTSTVFHILNAILIFIIFEILGLSFLSAMLAGLIFLIHPVNTETVTYSIRGDLFGLFFLLTSFLLFLRYCFQPKKIIFGLGCGLSLVLGLLSKETAVVIPFIIFWYYWIYRKNLPVQAKRLSFVLLGLAAIYLTIRLKSIFVTPDTEALSMIANAGFWERIITLPRILFTYLRLSFIPWQLHMEYHFVQTNVLSIYVWLISLGLIGIGYEIKQWLNQQQEELRNIFLLCLGWFFIGLIPFYNIVIKLHATVLEHWLYLALPGLIGCLALFIRQIWIRSVKQIKILLVLIFSLIAVYYCGYTIYRNWQWQEPMRLYQHDLACEPNSFVLQNNVGVMYFRLGDLANAKKYFQAAIAVTPHHGYDVAWNNLGVIYENENDLDSAQTAYVKSIDLNRYELGYANLSRMFLRKKAYSLARDVAAEGLKMYPFNHELIYNFGVAQYYLNNYLEAYEVLSRLRESIGAYRQVDEFLIQIKTLINEKNKSFNR